MPSTVDRIVAGLNAFNRDIERLQRERKEERRLGLAETEAKEKKTARQRALEVSLAKEGATPEEISQFTGAEIPGTVSPLLGGISKRKQEETAGKKLLQAAQLAKAKRKDSPAKAGKLGLTPGQEALDKAFAKDLAEFEAGGGSADVAKGLSQLQEAKTALETTPGLTGVDQGFVQSIPFVGPGIRKAFSPESVNVQQSIEEVVQRNLRLVLGAQFTEKEGERLIARAFDETLPQDINARRVERLMTQIQNAAEAKQAAADYFRDNGTLRGFQGKIFGIKDFQDAVADEGPGFDTTQFQAKIPGVDIQNIQAAPPLQDQIIPSAQAGGQQIPLAPGVNITDPVRTQQRRQRILELQRKAGGI